MKKMNGLEYFIKAMKTWSLRGRARRKEYWYFVLFNLLINIGAYILFLSIFGLPMEEYMNAMAEDPYNAFGNALILYGSVTYLLSFVVSLIFLIPGICVTVRRLHDTGRSGWWYFISFVPLIGGITMLVFMLLDGNVGPNKYGEDPRQGDYTPATDE